jgi:hypothetical protein
MEDLAPWAQVLHIDLEGKHPDDGFSGVPYEKGALFLRRVEEIAGREDFDRFLRGWFDEHAFQSVTTGDFVAWLREGLPEVPEAMDLVQWIERPGLPDDAPRAESAGMARVRAEAERFRAGTAPAGLETEGWVTQQWLAFLEGEADRLDAASMAALDEAFGFTATDNCEVLCVWLRLAAQHGYEPAAERTEAFLMRVGRAKFLRPIYRELHRQTPERAREIYRRARPRYHAVSRGALDRILDWKS